MRPPAAEAGRGEVAGMRGRGVASSDRRMVWMTGAVAAAALLAACGPKKEILAGERFPVDLPLEASQPVEGRPVPVAPPDYPAPEARPIALPAVQANAEWAQRGANARHDAPHAALSAAPRLAWAVAIGQGESRRNRIGAAPVVAAGRIFTMDAGATVSAVSTAGGLLWQADLTPAFDRGGGVSGGGLAAEGGRLYATTGYGEVVALDAASGRVLWRQRTDSALVGAPMVAGGVIYVSGRDGSAWAIGAADGKVAWQAVGTPGSEGYLGAAAPTDIGRAVVFPGAAGSLMAVLKEGGGVPLWQESLAGRRLGRVYAQTYDITGDAVLSGGTLYAGTAAGRTVAMAAESGARIWSADEGAMAPPVVAGGSLFVVSDEARLVRLDAATGAVVWSVALPYFQAEKPKRHKAIHAHFGPVLAGGRLWVASSDGFLRGFSALDGALQAEVALPGGAASQPAVAGGTLYVVTRKGQLLAFR